MNCVWQAGLNKYDELVGIEWEWQSVNGCRIKAPLARESAGPNPTDRRKRSEQSECADRGNGVPLSLIVTGVNRHDSAVLEALLDDRFIPVQLGNTLENHCLDAGMRANRIWLFRTVMFRIFALAAKKKGVGKHSDFRVRRWVVESFCPWMKRFRKHCLRYEKTLRSFKALLSLAAGLIALNKVITIYG